MNGRCAFIRSISFCGSGRELIERGYGHDVRYCSQIDVSSVVPVLWNNHFINLESY
ncbi:2-phosphosulfolactate phosphatase [Paenibacillus spongiae]|uniref:2-phosphosulfolactate phosphatase n=1 Tax=Paenibacillus spongiae TaxID=2909671 RepID=A0ABY5SAE0_9BACL|nr:2-phosphosulfolactate phosphatase [Paenibacillus spongiae]UVI30473.1 2-phosphosulfolactate phosphatase [Paenibacillus spongiae]